MKRLKVVMEIFLTEKAELDFKCVFICMHACIYACVCVIHVACCQRPGEAGMPAYRMVP